MASVHNFSAGPAALPASVLRQVKQDLPDFQGHGVSIMEMSHRGPVFAQVFEQAQHNLRTLLGIADDYEILFLQGGAQTQFALVPMNLASPNAPMAYANTGHWSNLAIQEAKKFGEVAEVASSAPSNFTLVPDCDTWQIPSNSAYLHITPNETIHGLEFYQVPKVSADLPLVADMSSTILSRPFDVHQYGVIYAGAQKNIGPAGVTLVIIRKDLLQRSTARIPNMLNYQSHAIKGSMYNTPPTFAIYLSGLVFQWLLEQGGLSAIAQVNQGKATALYECIDQSSLYHNTIAKQNRSWMNVPFTLADQALEARFLTQANEQNLLGLKGHKALGGIRASLYNAVPRESVDALIQFMKAFEQSC